MNDSIRDLYLRIYHKIQERRDIIPKLAVFILGIGFTLAALRDNQITKSYFTNLTYYIVFLIVILWIWAMARSLLGKKVNAKKLIADHKGVLIVALFLSAAIFTSVKPALRIFSDEAVLVGQSRVMFEENKADFVTQSLRTYDEIKVVGRNTPKRPPLFPFLIHIIHVVRGYHYENVFILNFLALFGALALIGICLQKKWGQIVASSALILIVSHPIVSLTAASGSYDMVFCLLMIISFLSLREYLERSSQKTFEFLWMNLIMLANVRRESFIYAGLILVLLATCRRLQKEHFLRSYTVALSPLFLSQLIWHKSLRMCVSLFAESGHDSFSWLHFLKNNAVFFRKMIYFDYFYPFANIVILVGFIALIALPFLNLRQIRSWNANQKIFAFISTTTALFMWVLYTSHHRGGLHEPGSNRYYLIPSILLSLFAMALLYKLLTHRRRAAALLVLSCVCWLTYHPIAIQNTFLPSHPRWLEYQIVAGYLEGFEDRDFNLITEKTPRYTIYDYGAITFGYANSQKAILSRYMKSHIFKNLLVLQRYHRGSLGTTQRTRLDKAYVLETLLEKQIRPGWSIRLSKVVDIKL